MKTSISILRFIMANNTVEDIMRFFIFFWQDNTSATRWPFSPTIFVVIKGKLRQCLTSWIGWDGVLPTEGRITVCTFVRVIAVGSGLNGKNLRWKLSLKLEMERSTYPGPRRVLRKEFRMACLTCVPLYFSVQEWVSQCHRQKTTLTSTHMEFIARLRKIFGFHHAFDNGTIGRQSQPFLLRFSCSHVPQLCPGQGGFVTFVTCETLWSGKKNNWCPTNHQPESSRRIFHSMEWGWRQRM